MGAGNREPGPEPGPGPGLGAGTGAGDLGPGPWGWGPGPEPPGVTGAGPVCVRRGQAAGGAPCPAQRPSVREQRCEGRLGFRGTVLLGFGAFSVRFGVFAAFSARLPESRALRAAPLGARCSGSTSALGSILGIPAEKPACALGQHPPPVATSKGERYQPGTVPGAVSGALATFRLLLPPQRIKNGC